MKNEISYDMLYNVQKRNLLTRSIYPGLIFIDLAPIITDIIWQVCNTFLFQIHQNFTKAIYDTCVRTSFRFCTADEFVKCFFQIKFCLQSFRIFICDLVKKHFHPLKQDFKTRKNRCLLGRMSLDIYI